MVLIREFAEGRRLRGGTAAEIAIGAGLVVFWVRSQADAAPEVEKAFRAVLSD
ncbi:MAG: hypothetical protein H5T86_08890 [Armatimonadetes bacterium]|nr:hypothetical protein [Armatimonadota bacterium]